MRLAISLLVFLAVVLIIAILVNEGYTDKIKKLEKDNARYEQNNKELRQQLNQSNQLRDSAFHTIRDLHTDIKDLLRSDSLIIVEINKKGRFDNFNSSQLRQEMIKRYDNR